MFKLTMALLVVTVTLNVYAANRPQIDPEFMPYVADFEKYFKRVDVNVIFGHHIADEAAVCDYNIDSNKFVLVNENTWRRLSLQQRSQLIFHELGHCVLGLDHDSKFTTLKGMRVPRSVMHHHVFSDHFAHFFEQNKSYYIEELQRKVRTTKIKIFDR